MGISKSLFETGILFTYRHTRAPFSPLCPQLISLLLLFNLKLVSCFCIHCSPALPLLMALEQFSQNPDTNNHFLEPKSEKTFFLAVHSYCQAVRYLSICSGYGWIYRPSSPDKQTQLCWNRDTFQSITLGMGGLEKELCFCQNLQHHQRVPERGQNSLCLKEAECREVVNTPWSKVLAEAHATSLCHKPWWFPCDCLRCAWHKRAVRIPEVVGTELR